MAYNVHFMSGKPISLPKLPRGKKNEPAPLRNGRGHVIHYLHHSVVMNKKRKFAFFSACNINGAAWKNMNRRGVFKKDQQAVSASCQFGNELYDAIKASGLRPNDFEQGHLTSFEEVLWGKTAAVRRKAADDTFYFTNCVPQHARLNAGLWRSLEQYILKTQTVQHELKVTVVTGPVLSDDDPFYIKEINGRLVKIPCIFWKIVYYPNKRGLNAVGFMMSHTRLLLQDGTVTFKKNRVQERAARVDPIDNLFMDFKYDAVYQVKVEFIQEKTGLRFMLKNVHLPYRQNVKTSVLYKRIEVPAGKTPAPAASRAAPLDFMLTRITL